jgi:hypothetical protein
LVLAVAVAVHHLPLAQQVLVEVVQVVLLEIL